MLSLVRASEISVEISWRRRRKRSVVWGFSGGDGGEVEEEATGRMVEGEYCRRRAMKVSKNWGEVRGYVWAKTRVTRWIVAFLMSAEGTFSFWLSREKVGKRTSDTVLSCAEILLGNVVEESELDVG